MNDQASVLLKLHFSWGYGHLLTTSPPSSSLLHTSSQPSQSNIFYTLTRVTGSGVSDLKLFNEACTWKAGAKGLSPALDHTVCTCETSNSGRHFSACGQTQPEDKLKDGGWKKETGREPKPEPQCHRWHISPTSVVLKAALAPPGSGLEMWFLSFHSRPTE